MVVSNPVPAAPPPEPVAETVLPGPPPESLPVPSLALELFPDAAGPTVPLVPPTPPAEPPSKPIPPIAEDVLMFPQAASGAVGTREFGITVKNATTFRIEEPMQCSLCHGEISGGLLAARCSCGKICHLSCGIKLGGCQDCGTDYGGMMNSVSGEAIIASVVDSRKTARREVASTVEGDEKDDMIKKLLKRVLNGEISMDEYKMLAADIKKMF